MFIDLLLIGSVGAWEYLHDALLRVDAVECLAYSVAVVHVFIVIYLDIITLLPDHPQVPLTPCLSVLYQATVPHWSRLPTKTVVHRWYPYIKHVIPVFLPQCV